ncbi:Phage portal protein [Rickettsiales endosymbiont of Paramecium tredecaurelia]|uniref:phage portal protein n=1 Tax=Candidatus Sarmatiella mevalonica TaxID=2770581 RepID=UPI0019204AD0|nr:phage portal protein [Candidatus Sarmatiella mevalonica]MBL3284354.1 Phage portal protein [Candidatus Sarmatiella mevalonica]
MIEYLKKFFRPHHFFNAITKKNDNDFGLGDMMHSRAFGSNTLAHNEINSYKNNVFVRYCVDMIANAVSHVPMIIHIEDKRASNAHPLYRLLKKPTHTTSYAQFLRTIMSHKLLFGNAYVLGLCNKGSANALCSLHILHPSCISLEYHKESHEVVGYKYRAHGKEVIYKIHPISGTSKILHIYNYNPNNPYCGLSVLETIKQSIELIQATNEWNNSLLKNGARPSGALILKDDNKYLSEEQFQRIKEELYQQFSGYRNCGKPLLLEGGLQWQEISFNPKDMDFISSKHMASKEIALAFGIPPQLLGISGGENKYNNIERARISLWEEKIIPELKILADFFSNWFSCFYQQDLSLSFDLDAVSALIRKRQKLWSKISSASFMTLNEKRTIAGLKPIDDANADKLSTA